MEFNIRISKCTCCTLYHQRLLATAIQTAINADSTLVSGGKSVVVTHSNGTYSITSGSIGSSSSIVVSAIGSNLNGFLKMSGTLDAVSISAATVWLSILSTYLKWWFY